MPRTAPATQTAGTTITSTIWNDQVKSNLEFLLALKRNGSAITGLADGAELTSNLIASNGANAISTSSGITITGIPATYKHLRLIVLCQWDSASGSPLLLTRVGNGSLDSGSNYNRQSISLADATPSYQSIAGGTSLTNPPLALSTGIGTYLDILILYYTASGIRKNAQYTVSSIAGTLAADQNYWSGRGLWTGTSVIDTVGFLANTGDMRNIRYELYGVV